MNKRQILWRWRAALAGVLLAMVSLVQAHVAPVVADPVVLRYAEIIHGDGRAVHDAQAVTLTDLLRQLLWLRDHDYHFVSLQQVQAAKTRRHALPEHAVLLCFDEPATQMMLPLLSILHVIKAPALVGMASSSLPQEAGRQDRQRRFFADPAITLASEGQGLNRRIAGDPQGDRQWAATTRAWLPRQWRYERETAYRQRVTSAVATSIKRLQRSLHQPVAAMLWPGGAYNDIVLAQALRAGVAWSIGAASIRRLPGSHILTQTWVTPAQAPWDLGRDLSLPATPQPVRLMHVNLDYVYDRDPRQEASNLEHLLARVRASDVNTVYLQAFADPDGNGAADAVYFPNRHLPMRQDLFNHVVAALHAHTQVRHVFAWMPLLAWQLPVHDAAARDLVVTLPSRPNFVSNAYPRLSPFSTRAVAVIQDMFEDLGRHARIDGVLFHDDMTLSDYEDDSRFAHSVYRRWGLPAQVQQIRAEPAAMQRWSFLKTRYLDHLALHMAAVVASDHPGLLTARNMYAQVVLHKVAETWYAQSLESSIANFDETAIEAMPFMEKAPYHAGFYHELFDHVRALPHGLQKTIFELQAKDWRQGGAPLPSTLLASTICMLFDWGVINVGYIPDDPFKNSPDLDILRPALEHHCAQVRSQP